MTSFLSQPEILLVPFRRISLELAPTVLFGFPFLRRHLRNSMETTLTLWAEILAMQLALWPVPPMTSTTMDRQETSRLTSSGQSFGISTKLEKSLWVVLRQVATRLPIQLELSKVTPTTSWISKSWAMDSVWSGCLTLGRKIVSLAIGPTAVPYGLMLWRLKLDGSQRMTACSSWLSKTTSPCSLRATSQWTALTGSLAPSSNWTTPLHLMANTHGAVPNVSAMSWP